MIFLTDSVRFLLSTVISVVITRSCIVALVPTLRCFVDKRLLVVRRSGSVRVMKVSLYNVKLFINT